MGLHKEGTQEQKAPVPVTHHNMINVSTVQYYDEALALLLDGNNGGTTLSAITEVCSGNGALAQVIADELKDRGFANRPNSRYIIDTRNGKAKLFRDSGGFAAELEENGRKAEPENELKQIQKENLKLQNENFEHAKTVREQDGRIRTLEEKLKEFEVVKNRWWVFEKYWWAFTTAFGVGYAAGKFLFN